MNKIDDTIFGLLKRLDAAKIFYRLNSVRAGALMVEVAVPGERWEIELLDDGTTEVEIFKSSGEMLGAEALDMLVSRFAD